MNKKLDLGMYSRLDKLSLSSICKDASIITIVSVICEDAHQTCALVKALIPGEDCPVDVWITNSRWKKIDL